MAVDNTTDGQSPDPDASTSQPSGTANLIQNVSDYLQIEAEYDKPVASGLMRKSLEEVGIKKTVGDIQAWADVNQALLTRPVSVGKTHDKAKAKTDACVNQIINAASTAAPDAPSVGRIQPADTSLSHEPEQLLDDQDDEFEEDDAAIDEPEYDSLMEIFGTDDPDDAEEQALDYVLKLSEKID